MDGMPNSLAGLLVFVAVLLPGFVFITIYTWDRPRRRWSTLEETAAILLASMIAETVVAGLYAGIRLRTATAEPGLDLLILKPAEHLGWVAGLLAEASVLAALTAWLLRGRRVHPAVTSSWWTLFDSSWVEGDTTYVQCVLDDGSSVTGVLGDWNTCQEESPDRDIILKRPITYRPPGGQEYLEHRVSAVCISASRIVAMFVANSDEHGEPTSTPAEAAEVEEAEEAEAAPSRAQAAGAGSAGAPGPRPRSRSAG